MKNTSYDEKYRFEHTNIFLIQDYKINDMVGTYDQAITDEVVRLGIDINRLKFITPLIMEAQP